MLWAILCGGCASLIVLFGLFYWMRVLEPEDRARFTILARALPMSIGRTLDKVLVLLIRPDIASITPTNV